MHSPRTEENFPLLLLFLEEGNKSRESKYRLFGGNNRYTRISEGAGNVISQWPAHVSNCWVSIFLFTIIFFMMILTFLAISIHPAPFKPKCTPYDLNESNLKIYLVHSSETWSRSEVEGVKALLKNYPRVRIEIIELFNHTNKRLFRRRARKEKVHVLDRNMNYKYLLGKLVDGRLLKLRNESMEDYFAFTPLYSAWRKLSADLVEFSARTVMLWEYGGISFKLPKLIVQIKNATNRFNASTAEEWKVDAFAKSNLTTYEKLSKEVVNIDDEGVHMETKTPCHAFFGELLMNIRSFGYNSTVSSLIIKTLKTFCKSGAVNDDFCSNFAGN